MAAQPPPGGGMPVEEPVVARMDRESIAVAAVLLTRLSEDQLDALIVEQAETSFSYPRFALASLSQLRFLHPLDFFRKLRRIKKKIIQLPGQGVGALIRWRSRDGGYSFCIRIRYCKRRNRIREQMEEMGDFVGDRTGAKDWLGDRAPDVLEIAGEIAEEIGDLVTDALLVPLIARVLVGGLDDICPCCEECDGTGKTKGEDCQHCGGTGQRKP